MTDTTAPVVLIVEDEPGVAETYELWLADEYEVRVASDGEEGLAKLDEAVNVVLLDRMMPGLSGGEVLDRIRDRELNCRVAMVTAVEPDFDILEMGFDAYLSKHVRSEELRNTIEKLLERSTYDSLLQEYYALVEKQAALETAKSTGELEESDEYARLDDRIGEIRDELSLTMGAVANDSDFISSGPSSGSTTITDNVRPLTSPRFGRRLRDPAWNERPRRRTGDDRQGESGDGNPRRWQPQRRGRARGLDR